MPESRTAALAMCFTAGILAASYCSPLGWLTLGVVVGGVAVLLARRSARPGIVILAAVFFVGAAWYGVRMQVPADDISRLPGIRAFDGTIAADPDVREDSVRLLITADSAETWAGRRDVSGLVLINVDPQHDQPVTFEYGDRVRIAAHPYSPFDPTNPGQFSWKAYLQRQGIYACASVRNPTDITILPGDAANPIVSFAYAAKHYLSSCVSRIHPHREATVIIGIVMGTYSYLPRATIDNFSRTGTLHLLAASGFNCFILAFMVTWVLKRLRFTGRWIVPITLCALGLYLIAVGPKASIVRATVMAGLWLLAPPFKRLPNIKNLFFTAVVVTLLMNPSDLFDVGFQLSFAAVWALITASSIIERGLRHAGMLPDARKQSRFHPALRWVVGELLAAGVATVTVTFYTAPIIAYHFNYISLVSLPANIALALGVYVVTAVGLASLALAYVPYVGICLGWFGTKVTDAMLGVVNYLGSGSYSAVYVASPSLVVIIGYYALLYVALDWLRSLTDER